MSPAHTGRSELTPVFAGRDDDVEAAVEYVARKGTARRAGAVNALGQRTGWDRMRATAAIDRAIKRKLIYETTDGRARVLRIEAPKPERRPELTASRLRWMLARADRGQSWLANQLDLTQPQVASWLRER